MYLNSTFYNHLDELIVPSFIYCKGDEKLEQSSWLNFVFFGVLLTVIILAGVISNMLSIFVVTRPSLQSKVRRFLIAIAAWEIPLLICAFFAFSEPILIHGLILR